MSSRTFPSILPRQSPRPSILLSINAEADTNEPDFFIYSSRLRQTILAALRAPSLETPPEEVRKSPKHAGGRRPSPGLRTVPHRDMSDEGGGQVDGEACVSPLLQPRRQG